MPFETLIDVSCAAHVVPRWGNCTAEYVDEPGANAVHQKTVLASSVPSDEPAVQG
jgi:hypothetical protein